jgi:hypothetical protein
MPVKKKTPRLITKALHIVRMMERWDLKDPRGRSSVVWALNSRKHQTLERILTDLDARESVVQPSRRAAHGLKERRRTRRID